MTLQEYGLLGLAIFGFVAWLAFFFEGRDVISDQQEVKRRRREWRGDFGLGKRVEQVTYVRGNWATQLLFGAALCVLALVALFLTWRV